jgi:hypothetical protein
MRIFFILVMLMVLVSGQKGFNSKHEVMKRNFLRSIFNEFKNEWYTNESHRKRVASSSNDLNQKKHGSYSIPCLMNVISCYSHGK